MFNLYPSISLVLQVLCAILKMLTRLQASPVLGVVINSLKLKVTNVFAPQKI